MRLFRRLHRTLSPTTSSLTRAATAADTPWARPDARDELTGTQRRGVMAGIVAAHLSIAYALLQLDTVRATVREVSPVFVDWIAPPGPAAPAPPPQPATAQRLRPPPPPAPAIAAVAEDSSAPAPFTVEPPPAVPAPAQATPAPPDPRPPVAAPPVAPRLIPATAVQFAEPPVVEYPRLSRRNGESGRVVLRVFIGSDGGAARSVQVERSSGHPRLDVAALAALQRARFKAHTDNGRPVEGWALVPIDFQLEK